MRILYEDNALLFVDKPPGIVVQRGYDESEPVLFEQIEAYTRSKGERAFLLQRLDRGTSGVMFFSKLPEMNARLTRQFERKQILKTYMALCNGMIRGRQTIDAPLARIGPISFGVRDAGKRAVTEIDPLAHGPAASLVSIRLMTGRTHQIRVHLAAIGHPLAGDWLYGERDAERPMLHSTRLEMIHPLSGGELVVEAPVAADFLKEMESRGVRWREWGPNASDREDRVT